MRSFNIFTQQNRRRIINLQAAINEKQKAILQTFIKFYLDDFACLSSENEIKALEACTSNSISPDQIELFQELEVWSTIQAIKIILNHPHPQNRIATTRAFGAPINSDDVAFEDATGEVVFEKQGLLGLSARNDDTALPITKEATIDYIHLLINKAKSDCSDKERNTASLQDRSFIDSSLEVNSESWALAVCLNCDEEKCSIFIEGVRKNNKRFLDQYEVCTNSNGLYTLAARSIYPLQFSSADSKVEKFKIYPDQGIYLQRCIKQDIDKLKKPKILSMDYDCWPCSSNIEAILEWCKHYLNQISINHDPVNLMAEQRRFCSIM